MRLKNNDVALRKKVHSLMESKRWTEAHNLLNNLDINDQYYFKHISQCARLEHELLEYINEAAILQRLKTVLKKTLFKAAKYYNADAIVLVNCKPVLNGHVCIYALKITCRVNKQVFTFFEKIFPIHRTNSANNEAKIYLTHLLDNVHAPKFYGTLSAGNLISNYYEWIDSSQVSLKGYFKKHTQKVLNPFSYYLSHFDDERKLGYKTLEKLWSNQLDLNIVGSNNIDFKNTITKFDAAIFLSDQKLDQFMQRSALTADSKHINKLVMFIKNNRMAINNALNNMPIILMLHDFNQNNMLVNEQLDVILIDWEKYGFSRVGDGFFRFYNFKPRLLFKVVLRKLAFKYHLSYKDLLIAIVVYEVSWAINNNKLKFFEKLCGLIDDYFPKRS